MKPEEELKFFIPWQRRRLTLDCASKPTTLIEELFKSLCGYFQMQTGKYCSSCGFRKKPRCFNTLKFELLVIDEFIFKNSLRMANM